MMQYVNSGRGCRHIREQCLFSVSLIALLTAPVCSFADQLAVTDGSSIIQNGGSFNNVSSADNGAALYASNAGSTIIGSDLIINTGSYTSAAVFAGNGGTIELTGNTAITGGYGLLARGGNAQITMDGGTITSTTSAVRSESGSSISLNNVTINDSSNVVGSSSVQAFYGSITMTGGSITATGLARGVYVLNGMAILDGVRISSVSEALFNQQSTQSGQPNLTVKNFTIDTTANNAYGLNANIYSNTLLEDGTIHTRGNNAYGIWATASSSAVGSTIVNGANLTIQTEGLNAHGIFTNAAAVNLTNTNIAVARAYGLYAQSAGTLSYNGGSITVAGADGSAVLATAPGSKIDVVDVTIETTANSTRGLYSHNQSVITAKNSTISVSGSGSYGIVSTSQGTVAIDDTTVDVIGADSYGLVFLGATALNQITITGGSVSSRDSAAIVANGGTDVLSLTNTTVSGDTLLYAGAYSQSGNIYGAKFSLTADNSTLKGGVLVDEYSTSTLNLNNGSAWTLTPPNDTVDSAVSVLNLNNSSVAFSAPTANNYQTLTIGSGVPGTMAVYNATGNAWLHLNTFLNEGGALSNQKTDRLLINADASGTTMVTVTGTAGSPGGETSLNGQNLASEGISIIQVSGTAAESSFQLPGGYVTLNGMPYQYSLRAYGPGASNGAADESQRLVMGTDPFWDYRLQGVYVDLPAPPDPYQPDQPNPPVRAVAPQVASYLTAPVALYQAGLLDITNLHRRLGEIRDDRATGRNGGTGEFFIRGYGGKYDYASNRNAYNYGYDANIDYAAVQMGGNLYAFENKTGIARFGAAGSIGALSFDPKNVTNANSTNLDTWSVSAYGTYLHDSNWYADGILAFGGFDGHVSTSLRGRTAGLSGNSFSASLETGYPFKLGDGIVIEPQAQMIYQRLMFNGKFDVDGFPVRLGNQDQVTARIGGSLSKTYAQREEGQLITVYAKANLLYSFNDGGKVYFGDDFRLGRFGTSIEGGIGINATVTKNFSLYGDAAYQHRAGSSGISGFTLTGGGRYTF